MNRRDFLKESAQFAWKTSALALLLSEGKWVLGDEKAFAETTADPRLILLKSIKGPVLLPTDSRYAAKAQVFSERHSDIHPTVIALCMTESDIVRSLQWALQNKVPFRVKSGGHSYEAYSSCNGLVIDLSLMNSITIDSKSNTAVIGAGARLGLIYETLAAQGFAFVGGSCPFVGIGGLAQGGGFGMLSREYGLVIDNILSFRLITADGTILTVSENENPDLFWACRGGGGGNFGIITQYEFKIHPLKKVSLFRMSWPATQTQEAFLAWQTWAGGIPNSITSIFSLSASHSGISSAHLTGQFTGTTAELTSILKPLMTAISPKDSKFWDLNFIDAIHYYSGGDKGAPEMFKAKSDYMSKPWTAEEVAFVLQKLVDPGNQGVTLMFDHYGGAIADVAPDATAFAHRAGIFAGVQYYAGWSAAAETAGRVASLNAVHQSLRPVMSGQSYPNYIDADLANWAEAYYGENLPRLRTIKAKIDPNRVFDFPQAIR